MKSHYELLGIAPSADQQAVKQAFRREIARYHPDKVQHLGLEFQQMASVRAAELTAAYNTLSNPALRAEYDAALSRGAAPVGFACPAPPVPQTAPAADVQEPLAAPTFERFQQERADRDGILRRAVLARVRECFADPDYDDPLHAGFDLSFVPKARAPVFRRAGKPSLLIRVADKVDGPLVIQAWTDALRARLAEKPVVVLLLAGRVERRSIIDTIEDRRKKHPKVAESIFPVAVDMSDWSAEVPPHAPAAVRGVVERLRNFNS